MQGLMTNTINIAWVKLLFIAAKNVKNGNPDKVKGGMRCPLSL